MTPQVNEDETVSLFVEPSVTTVAASTFFPSDFLDPTTREVRTTARVKNHETLVIGGLIDRNDSTSDRRVPFFHRLPVLGHAFSYKARDNTDRELLIFITPHIVKGYDSLAVPSATAPYRDVAVKRMLDHFTAEEVGRVASPLEDYGDAHQPIYREEKRLVEESARRLKSNPKVEQEMGRALDSVGQGQTPPAA
jgi:type II secretory pathway component GspD/PulD (secretin)